MIDLPLCFSILTKLSLSCTFIKRETEGIQTHMVYLRSDCLLCTYSRFAWIGDSLFHKQALELIDDTAAVPMIIFLINSSTSNLDFVSSKHFN